MLACQLNISYDYFYSKNILFNNNSYFDALSKYRLLQLQFSYYNCNIFLWTIQSLQILLKHQNKSWVTYFLKQQLKILI